MGVKEALMMKLSEYKIHPSVELAILIPVVSMALSTITAGITFRIGIPDTLSGYLWITVWVSVCVSVPMALLAAQYDYRIRQSHKRLEALASTDPLTGLLNRRSFRSAVQDELARMQRSQSHGAIALIDLDHFKSFNDRFGHEFGDFVLCEVAVLLHDELRNPFDKVARWGGEEFIVLVSNVTPMQAGAVFERLRARIEAHGFEFNGEKARVTASFGIRLFDAMSDFDHTVLHADKALYSAKAAGRNRVAVSEDVFTGANGQGLKVVKPARIRDAGPHADETATDCPVIIANR